MNMRFLAALAPASLLGLWISQPARAGTFGTGAILTNRPCAEAVGTNCLLGQPRTFTQFAGGLDTTFAISAINENNSGASGSAYVTFGDSYLPTIGVASFSASQTRTGASADAFRAYTYNGSQAINLALTGALHYITSGDDGVQGEAAGEGIFNVNLAVLPMSAFDLFGTTAIDIISAPGSGFTDCGGGATAAAYIGSAGTTGENRKTINLSTNCSGGAITLNHGDSFLVYAGLQAISNRGGSLDASHTFSMAYDPVNTVFTNSGASVGAAFLAANVAPVPELATWAMMVGGFAMIAGSTRYRRRKTKIAFAFA